jgi:hypothetical protein
VSARGVHEYQGDIGGALMFEADNIEQAVEKARKSPGLKYGWEHDVLEEMTILSPSESSKRSNR